jgi:Skp family chaperone for outer membrane proteins
MPEEIKPSGADLNLEKLREILFGADRRDIERRLNRLDERLDRELTQLRKAIEDAVEPIERFGREEIQSLGGRLRDQEQLRMETFRASEERAKQLVEELRTHTLEQIKLVADQFRRREDAFTTAIKKAIRELDLRKMDRAALAGLLSETAVNVTREPIEVEEAEEKEKHH